MMVGRADRIEASGSSVPSPRRGLFVAGEWVEAHSDGVLVVEDPATGKELATVLSTSPDGAVAAAEAAADAQRHWRRTTSTERADILVRIAELLEQRRERLARTIVLEAGKPLAEAEAEVDGATSFFRWYSDEIRRVAGRILMPVMGKQPLVVYEPYGVVLAITPWNDPLGMPARKLSAAIAAGCAVVLKPAPETPLTALALAEIVAEAGVPAGVVNVVACADADTCISRLLDTGLINKVSFTGSTEAGRLVASRAAAAGVSAMLELGGNAACVVLPDADLDVAAAGIILRKFRNAGQGCTCVNRLFVPRPLVTPLLERIVERTSTLLLGHGLEPQTKIGPLIRRSDVDRVQRLADAATAMGARVVWRGHVPREPSLADGHFYPPVVLTDVADEMQLARDETFGPLLPVLEFETVEEAIDRANSVRHGLAGYVYGGLRALEVAKRFEAGLVGVNDPSPQAVYYPVGGVKASGWGVEGGREGLLEYVSPKAISLALDAHPTP